MRIEIAMRNIQMGTPRRQLQLESSFETPPTDVGSHSNAVAHGDSLNWSWVGIEPGFEGSDSKVGLNLLETRYSLRLVIKMSWVRVSS